MSQTHQLARTARQRGLAGEGFARRKLEAEGYSIHAVRAKRGRGEIDIIAEQAGELVFAEVKSYRKKDSARLAMTESKCQRLREAALLWLGEKNLPLDTALRFDLISLSPRPSGGFEVSHEKALPLY